ncbi:MAG: SusD/RagB family nutrient-binding outer membrane lipoprotein [Flavobacteriaceae bacterium]|nr:SusD/RagB family nutrient-binding outer membrane lipoprotein [Flavobacteriaceae bacterium]
MKTTKNIKIIFAAILTLMMLSCETTELEILTDPQTISPSDANPKSLLNSIQLQFNDFIGNENLTTSNSLNTLTMNYTRMTQLSGTYLFDTSLINTPWRIAYAGLLTDVNTLIPLAEEKGLDTHIGVAKILKAYTLVTLVDIFGKVPYSEALLAGANINPKLDDGRELYSIAIDILNSALQNLSNTDAEQLEVDYYFGINSREKWINVANTLKLKMFLQMRLIDAGGSTTAINALINDNLIDTESEDFAFNYLTDITPNDNRHPFYINNYNNGSLEFMSNQFMLSLKDSNDPRLRYYFYRQRLNDPFSGDLPCTTSGLELCYIGNGYFGRDHGDNNFTTSGMFQRNTTWGAYPAGGKFDDDSGVRTTFESGALGEGIRPLLLSSFTNFMLAEAALTLGTTGSALDYLEQGIRQSINKAMSFGNLGNNSDAGFRPSDTDVNTYITDILNSYSIANVEGKLNIIMEQYYIALWGNGIETYNNYRRTGKPNNLQSPQSQEPTGVFPRVMQYPARTVSLNANISQQLVTNQVFWDNNDANFID